MKKSEVVKEPEKKHRLWFRVGMEATVTDEELAVLITDEPDEEAHRVMRKVIDRAFLSGETYIVANNCPLSDYANPDYDVDFDFYEGGKNGDH